MLSLHVFCRIFLYHQLALLFGTSWILAFVSEAVNHVIVSYFNVILNTLQGVFIFLAFCLNQRVRALCRKRLPRFAVGDARRKAGRQPTATVSMSTLPPGGSASVQSEVGAVRQENNFA